MDAVTLGKRAEGKVREWLDLPESGHDFNRIPDQLSGFYGSKNICDFYMYKYPYMYYIESKASYNDNIPFSMITEYQRTEMFKRSKIFGVRSIVVFLYATYKRAFILDIRDIQHQLDDPKGAKSLNVKKESSWSVPHVELRTIPSRKELLDYTGDLDQYVELLSSIQQDTILP